MHYFFFNNKQLISNCLLLRENKQVRKQQLLAIRLGRMKKQSVRDEIRTVNQDQQEKQIVDYSKRSKQQGKAVAELSPRIFSLMALVVVKRKTVYEYPARKIIQIQMVEYLDVFMLAAYIQATKLYRYRLW